MTNRILLTVVCAIVCATVFSQAAAQLQTDKNPQLYCGSNKSASGSSIEGDQITYFATINNITGPFAVHLYMKRIDCSPSCEPDVFSIFAADGKVRLPFCTLGPPGYISLLRSFVFAQGSHKEHQYQLREGQVITMDVAPEAGETQVSLAAVIAISQALL
jgi:hypothetical protein